MKRHWAGELTNIDRQMVLLAALVWFAHAVHAVIRAALSASIIDLGSMSARLIYTLIAFLLTVGVWGLLRSRDWASAWSFFRASIPLICIACAIHTAVSQLLFVLLSPVYRGDYSLFAWSELLPSYTSFLWIFFTWSGAGAALVGTENQRNRERRLAEVEMAAQEAQLRALRYQLQPHFLLNSLNTIASLLNEGRAAGAKATLDQLAEFLKHILALSPSALAPLRQELETQALYLSVEQMRFHDRLQIRMAVDPAVESALVPPMILQPLVENALTHGLARSLGPATIELGALREGDRLRLWVQDDARPSGPLRFQGMGIGLANVRSRLAAQYGEEAVLNAGAGADGGWRSELSLPYEAEVLSADAPAAGAGLGAQSASRLRLRG